MDERHNPVEARALQETVSRLEMRSAVEQSAEKGQRMSRAAAALK